MEARVYFYPLYSLLASTFVFGIQEFIQRPENTSVLQGQSVILHCVVRGRTGRVQWARDGFVLGYDRKIPGYSRYQVLLSNPEEFNLQIVNSSLKDDAQFQCQVGPSGGDPPLVAEAYLTVLDPPGKPVITGYTAGEVVRMGSTLRLRCVSVGGNPLAQLHWYRNDEESDFSYNSGGNKAENELVFQVQPHDNDAVYRCEASNRAVQIPLTSQVILIVHFPPTKVTVTGKELAKAGEVVTLSCESSNSNPPAVITWFAKGRPLPETTTHVKDSPEGGSISTSEVQVQLTDQENNIVYTCQATNPALGRTVADTITVGVQFPPSPPLISGYDEGSSIKAGSLLRLTCEAIGGNPVASVKWFKGDEELDTDTNIIGTISTAAIAIITDPSDNNAIYKCTAENEATDKPLEREIKLTVHFPPISVNITMIPAIPHAGEKTQLICVSESSNPPAMISWVHENRNQMGIDQGTTPAEYGGKSTRNILDIVPTWEDHGSVYGCGATNLLLMESVNDAITLDILFKPEFDEELSPTVVTILEGESRVLNYTAMANPPEITYSLLKKGEPTSDLALDKGEITISNVQRAVSGDYGIKADNAEGTTIYNMTMDVQFPAEIKEITSPVEQDAGGTAFFTCEAEANPVTDSMITWSREDFDMTKTKQTYEDGKGFLTVYELEKSDTGDFSCRADNGLGEPVTKTASLVVISAPEIDKSPELTKAASEKGSSGRLICKADGAPVISFKWIRDGKDVVPDEQKYTIEQKVEGILYENVLIVSEMTKDDYGVYICVASNEKGDDSFEITLDGTSKPDPPYDIKFINATHNSITLSWKPGFNGGLVQSFRVRYKSRFHGFIQVDTEEPGKTVFTLTGLVVQTEYEITVQSFNELGDSQYQVKGLIAYTSKTAPPGESQTTREDTEDAPIIIILVVCVVGIVLLALNVALILFFVRRRRKRMETHQLSLDSSCNETMETETTFADLQGEQAESVEPVEQVEPGSDTTSHTNTIELYNGVNKETPLYPVSPSDDNRSYGTYDKSIDEYSDDYKAYDEDDMKKVFLPTSDYGSVSYIPNKLDSPNMESQRSLMTDSKQTYLDDSDRHTPWQYEDPYKVATPRKKNTFDSEYPMHERSHSANLYDPSGRVLGRQETRPKSITDVSDRTNRPSSRSSGRKTPPAPPTRSTSKNMANNISPTQPPLPARNYDYDYDDLPPPRYAPPPGSLGTFSNNVNVVPNPTYDGPNLRTPSPRVQIAGDDMRGHLV